MMMMMMQKWLRLKDEHKAERIEELKYKLVKSKTYRKNYLII